MFVHLFLLNLNKQIIYSSLQVVCSTALVFNCDSAAKMDICSRVHEAVNPFLACRHTKNIKKEVSGLKCPTFFLLLQLRYPDV